MRGAEGGVVSREVVVESLDLEARGVARLPGDSVGASGKVIFIEGALPGERVQFESYRRKSTYEFARVTEVLRASSTRVEPRCPHFGVCGGCSMQHLDTRAQLAVKQRALEDALWHLARVRPDVVLRPIQGPDWHYRFRARLSVRHVPKKGGVLVGFHERKSSYIADMRECHILPAHVAAMLLPLRTLIASLSIRDRLPQIEYAQGEGVTALVLRILDPLSRDDEALLHAFAVSHDVQFWLQPKGPESIVSFDVPGRRSGKSLTYSLPEFGVSMPFMPTDFTQVNHRINRVLVSRALGLLDPQRDERVLDLFCGLGNFTLPLARRSASVHGVEGSATLIARARDNARANDLSNVTFEAANLFEVDANAIVRWGRSDKVLIDPPREGALEVARVFATAASKPRRLVYVSCNPSTLARDAAVLVHEGGYALRAAGAVNMFPHTSHVESIAVFEPVST